MNGRELFCDCFVAARLVDTRIGLFFEWGYKHRARIDETALVLPSFDFVQRLKDRLIRSSWVPAPDMLIPIEHVKHSIDIRVASLKTIQRAWLQGLRKRFGAEVLKTALRIFPRDLNLVMLSKVRMYHAILKARLTERPNLGPLLALDSSNWPHLADWGRLKSQFLGMGLSQRVWRWLGHCKAAYIAGIDWRQMSHLAWVHVHACLSRQHLARFVCRQTAAIQGFYGFSQWVRRNYTRLEQRPYSNVLRAMRLCLSHLEPHLGGALHRDIVMEEFPLISDWLLARVGVDWVQSVNLSRNWRYETLISHQTRWHLGELAFARSDQTICWSEYLGFGQLADHIQFQELGSLQSLLLEAKRMHHCVPSYIDRCLCGDIALFHLRISGSNPERATLELSRNQSVGWQITQLKGPCNMRVSEGIKQAANLLLERLIQTVPVVVLDGANSSGQRATGQH